MNITHSSLLSLALFPTLMLALLFPMFAQAATSRPTCSLEVTTSAGTVEVERGDRVLLRHRDTATIEWESKNADRAFDEDGDRIDLDGTATVSPSRTTTYEYEFRKGSRKTSCEVTFQVVSGAFDEDTLITKSTKPRIEGTASGTRHVQVKNYRADKKPSFTSRLTTVKKGEWDLRITKKLPKDEYRIELLGEKRLLLNTIASGTLAVGVEPKKETKKDTTLVVAPIPLLAGGIAKAGKSVPISYLQVINIGKVDAEVKGFTIKQNGTASTNAVIGLTAVDDADTFRSEVGGTEGSRVFTDNKATIPANVIIPAGTRKLFTLKAELSSNVIPYLGTQLRLDVTGVDSNASVRNAFPIRGTTWTISF